MLHLSLVPESVGVKDLAVILPLEVDPKLLNLVMVPELAGDHGSCNNITIKSGSVNAKSMHGAGIGSGITDLAIILLLIVVL